MKRSVLFLLVAGLFQMQLVAQEFKFEKEQIDYGKVVQGANGERSFEFTNVGDTPLVIKEVRSTCGCAIPKKPEKPIMPGEKGSIVVSYNTHALGGFSKVITIVSNAKQPKRRLKIKGFVVKKGKKDV
ncbi:conserved exported hypothetical protein [Tenacibaculum litopenaei]|jgi:hypothetical protein|uniref:DUF1573 domain-containing protein n=1 Tax=Tenacibaculum litopenaei TaxID=396016 RepID=UPI003893C60F